VKPRQGGHQWALKYNAKACFPAIAWMKSAGKLATSWEPQHPDQAQPIYIYIYIIHIIYIYIYQSHIPTNNQPTTNQQPTNNQPTISTINYGPSIINHPSVDCSKPQSTSWFLPDRSISSSPPGLWPWEESSDDGRPPGWGFHGHFMGI